MSKICSDNLFYAITECLADDHAFIEMVDAEVVETQAARMMADQQELASEYIHSGAVWN